MIKPKHTSLKISNNKLVFNSRKVARHTVSLMCTCLLCIYSALGQGCCSGGTPLTGNLDLTTGIPGMMEVRAIYDYNHLGDLVFEKKELEDKTRLRTTHATLLRIQYSLNEKWAFAGLFPYVSQTETIKTMTPSTSTTGQGIGDIVFLIQRNIINKRGYNFSMAFGVKAPTGPINRTAPIIDILLNPDLQPGTGAWDFLAISQFARADIILAGLDLQTAISYRYTSPADRFNGLQQYQFGNELQINGGINYRFFIGSNQWISQFYFRYRHTKGDKVDDFNAINTGGQWGYVIPGLTYMPSPNWGIGISAQLPVFRNLTGIQLTTSSRITGTVFYRFSPKRKTDIEPINY